MKHLESFASNLPVAVAVYNLQTGEYRFVTKEIESIIGHSVDSIIEGGVPFVQSLIHPDDVERINQENQEETRLIQMRPEMIKSHWVDFKYRLKHIEGHWVEVHTRGRVFTLDENKQVKEILNFTFDEAKSDRINFKELGKIALFSFDHFRETLNHDLKGHIHILEFLINELVEDSIQILELPAEEVKERLLSHSVALSEVSTKLNNLISNLG